MGKSPSCCGERSAPFKSLLSILSTVAALIFLRFYYSGHTLFCVRHNLQICAWLIVLRVLIIMLYEININRCVFV